LAAIRIQVYLEIFSWSQLMKEVEASCHRLWTSLSSSLLDHLSLIGEPFLVPSWDFNVFDWARADLSVRSEEVYSDR
jgi:hypothetical protein